MLMTNPSTEARYNDAFKTTGKALYKATGTESWVNENKTRFKQETELYPIYVGIMAIETYNKRKLEYKMRGWDERIWILYNATFNSNLSPRGGSIMLVVSFF